MSFVSRTLAIVSLLLGVSDLNALAAPADRATFREFRQQYEGIDRNAARRMFHQQYGRTPINEKSDTANSVQNLNRVEHSGSSVFWWLHV